MQNDNLDILGSVAPQQADGSAQQPCGQQGTAAAAQLEHAAQAYAAQVAAWAQQQGYDASTQQAYVQQAYSSYYQQYYAQQAAMQQQAPAAQQAVASQQAAAPQVAVQQQAAAPQAALFPGQQPYVGQAYGAQQPYVAAQSYAQQPYAATASAPVADAAAIGGDGDNASDSKEKKKKRRRRIIVIVLVVLLLAAAVAAWFFLQPKGNDRAGRLGQLDGKSTEEIQAELNRIVDEGMFSISVASYVEFENGESEGELKIENVPGNRYLMQVEIKRDDTGETVYKSGILDPNFHIQSDKLSTDLDPGTYQCTASFKALDPETEEEVGTTAAQMTIAVLS